MSYNNFNSKLIFRFFCSLYDDFNFIWDTDKRNYGTAKADGCCNEYHSWESQLNSTDEKYY